MLSSVSNCCLNTFNLRTMYRCASHHFAFLSIVLHERLFDQWKVIYIRRLHHLLIHDIPVILWVAVIIPTIVTTTSRPHHLISSPGLSVAGATWHGREVLLLIELLLLYLLLLLLEHDHLLMLVRRVKIWLFVVRGMTHISTIYVLVIDHHWCTSLCT